MYFTQKRSNFQEEEPEGRSLIAAHPRKPNGDFYIRRPIPRVSGYFMWGITWGIRFSWQQKRG